MTQKYIDGSVTFFSGLLHLEALSQWTPSFCYKVHKTGMVMILQLQNIVSQLCYENNCNTEQFHFIRIQVLCPWHLPIVFCTQRSVYTNNEIVLRDIAQHNYMCC
jgi:hypothetical protein